MIWYDDGVAQSLQQFDCLDTNMRIVVVSEFIAKKVHGPSRDILCG